MLGTIDGHLRNLDQTTEARVLIVTGAGDRAFCVGADITRLVRSRADRDVAEVGSRGIGGF